VPRRKLGEKKVHRCRHAASPPAREENEAGLNDPPQPQTSSPLIMKTTSIISLRSVLLAGIALATFTTGTVRADWPAHWHITITPSYPAYPPAAPACPPADYPSSRPARSDYQPHLAQSYRQGWMAGQMARTHGWPRDYRSAFLATGCGWESYFQEGYADGYDGRCMRH